MVEGVKVLGKRGSPHGDPISGHQTKRRRLSSSHPHELESSRSALPHEAARPDVSPDDKGTAAPDQEATKLSNLEKQPSEILQNILMRTIEHDLREHSFGMSKLGVETISNIRLVSKALKAHADAAGLNTLNSAGKSARADAIGNYNGFLQAIEERDNLLITTTNHRSPEYHANLGRFNDLLEKKSERVLGSVKFLKEKEQFNLLLKFRNNTQPDHRAKLLLSASEHPEDFYPGSRSQMHEDLINVLPSLRDEASLEKACKNLAKASDAGYLEDRHDHAMAEIERTRFPGIQSHFMAQVIDLGTTRSDHGQGAAKAVVRPLNFREAHSEARQDILNKLTDRSYGR